MKRTTIALLLLAAPAWAGWSSVGEDMRGTYYADTATIEKSSSTAKMWSLLDYRVFQRMVEVGYYSQKSHVEYDCIQQRTRGLHVALHAEHMGTGGVIYEDSSAREWESISPGSIAETMWKLACQ